MADVLILGMEMPKNGHVVIRIYSDGRVENETTEREIGTAAPIRAGHGRLIDADALYEVAKTRSMGIYGPCDFQCVITGNDILKAHTIVPIGGGEDG